MTNRIFATSLRAYQIRQPFRPFLIELKSGSALVVKHPEAVSTYSGAAVYFATDGAITMFDADSVAKLADVPTRRASA